MELVILFALRESKSTPPVRKAQKVIPDYSPLTVRKAQSTLQDERTLAILNHFAHLAEQSGGDDPIPLP